MAALKYETFAPESGGQEATSVETARQVAQAYRDGHAKGFAQGAEASAREHADAQDQLRGQFIEALRDSQMTHSGAQQTILKSFFPVVEALVQSLAPKLATEGLFAQLLEHLETALEARPDIKPVIACAPELAAGVRSALATWDGKFDVQEDSRLTPLEASLNWDDGFDHINMDRALEEVSQAVSKFNTLIQTETDEDIKHVG